VRCGACARRQHHLVAHDPWSVIDDADLRERLHHRASNIGHLIPA
jgi:hypothetical protein